MLGGNSVSGAYDGFVTRDWSGGVCVSLTTAILMAAGCTEKKATPAPAAAVVSVDAATDARPVAPSQRTDGGWSAVVDGLRGRLSVGDEGKGPMQKTVDLELESAVGSDPIEVLWGDAGSFVGFSLENAAGTVMVGQVSVAGYPVQFPYGMVLPGGATVRLPITRSAIEYPEDGGAFFRPTMPQRWPLDGGVTDGLYLRAKLVASAEKRKARPGTRAWAGPELALPRVALF